MSCIDEQTVATTVHTQYTCTHVSLLYSTHINTVNVTISKLKCCPYWHRTTIIVISTGNSWGGIQGQERQCPCDRKYQGDIYMYYSASGKVNVHVHVQYTCTCSLSGPTRYVLSCTCTCTRNNQIFTKSGTKIIRLVIVHQLNHSMINWLTLDVHNIMYMYMHVHV